jgi:hypothetical protein
LLEASAVIECNRKPFADASKITKIQKLPAHQKTFIEKKWYNLNLRVQGFLGDLSRHPLFEIDKSSKICKTVSAETLGLT